MLDRRCARVAAVRLPFATRTILEKDRPGGIGNFALSSARRSRNRLDEQAPRLSIARRRDGHGRSKRKTRIRCRRTRERFYRASLEKTRRQTHPAAFEQSRKSAATRERGDSSDRSLGVPAEHTVGRGRDRG